ncbi:MAG: DNA polymerase III subunit delta [Patescibacteria group bacterium]
MIFFVYGTEAHLCRQKISELQAGFIQKRDKSSLNVVRLKDDELDFDRLSQEALTTPFLGERKLIIIEQLIADMSAGKKKLRDQILDFLKAKESVIDNNLMFVDLFEEEKKIPEKDALFNFLAKQKFAYRLFRLKDRELSGWIKKYCESKKIKIAPAAVSELLLLVGNDLTQLTNELDKLGSYKAGEIIATADVKLLVKAKIDDDVFVLTDALGDKNRERALELLSRQFLSGAEPLALLGSINWQFKLILKAKTLLENNPRLTPEGAAKEIGVHAYPARKSLGFAKSFSLKQLINIQNDLLKLERQLKSGAKNPELLFDLFVIKHC